MSKQELLISKEVDADTEDCQSYTVPNGKKAKVVNFHGEAAYHDDVAVLLVWDVDGTREILWVVKGGGQCPIRPEITGNGTKKLGICLDNGLTHPVFMSGHALVIVED